MTSIALAPGANRAYVYRWVAAALILGAAVFRVLYFLIDCPLDLSPDEAHYWDWSRRLDWSYYSKGPLVAYLIRASCWLFGPWAEALTGSQMAAVRLPAVLCGSLLLASLYVLTFQVMRSDRLALCVVAIGLTLPVLAAGSSLMTIDAPYTCCWGWALVFGFEAVFRQARWAWPAAGMCIALGILAKYTMVLWAPLFALFLLLTPSLRGQLLRPGFWILVGVGALGAVPIFVWNMQHDWITLRHTQGHAGIGDTGPLLRWTGPLIYVGMQFALLLGYWFVAWAAAMAAHNPGRESTPERRYLWFLSVPVFVFFGLFSIKNGGGEPNWPITAYISGLVLMAGWLAAVLQSPRRWLQHSTRALVAVFAALGLGLSLLIHYSHVVYPLLATFADPPTYERPAPLRRFDPTCRLRGWRTLAAAVDQVRRELEAEGIEPVLAGASWSHPGELGFYCEGKPNVYSLGLALGDRHSQYDLWRPNPLADIDDFRGKTFILVGVDGGMVSGGFDVLEPTREVTHWVRGHALSRWQITVCRGYRGMTPRNATGF